jgi:hypothetical protein
MIYRMKLAIEEDAIAVRESGLVGRLLYYHLNTLQTGEVTWYYSELSRPRLDIN